MKATFLFLMLCATAFAQSPTATISGPTGGVPGDILILDATSSENAKAYAWESVPVQTPDGRPVIAEIEGGSKCIVASRPGKYTVVLAVSSADGGLDTIQWVVEVKGPQPPDPVDPVDPVVPDPKFPDGKFKLSKAAYDLGMKVSNKKWAAALAESYETAADRIEQGEWTDLETVREQTARLNVAALGGLAGPGIEHWEPWFKSMAERTGAVKSVDDHETAWREIAAGLRRVK